MLVNSDALSDVHYCGVLVRASLFGVSFMCMPETGFLSGDSLSLVPKGGIRYLVTHDYGFLGRDSSSLIPYAGVIV